MAVSRSFSKGRESFSGEFAKDDVVVEMLDEPLRWPKGAGLYCVMDTGESLLNRPRFQMQPLVNERDEIEALALSIFGLVFVLVLEVGHIPKNTLLLGAKYRPGRIAVQHPASESWITISWEDAIEHETLTLKFVRSLS